MEPTSKHAIPDPSFLPLKPGFRPVAGITCATHTAMALCTHPDFPTGVYACLLGHIVGREV